MPQRWKPGGIQNKIIETQFYQEGSFKVVPVSNFSQNNQGLLTFGTDLIGLLQKFRPHIIQVEQGSKSLACAQLILLNKLLKLQAKKYIIYVVESSLSIELACFIIRKLQSSARRRNYCRQPRWS